jgi:hypothetical protein
VLDWLQNWLIGAMNAIPGGQMDVSDLYFWELYLANLGSTAATEQDIAIDELSPSNCRRLIYNSFAVDTRYHTEPHSFVYHQKMIALLWKELLAYPINPDRKTALLYFLRRHNLLFKTMHLHDSYKMIRSKVYASNSR